MAKRVISRRGFIRLSLLGGIALGLTYIQQRTADMGLVNFLRWSLRGQLQGISPPAIVGLLKFHSYNDDIVSPIRDLWKISEMPDVKGRSILIKPNLVERGNYELAPTNPVIIDAAIEVLVELGASKIIVGEGSAFRRDTYSLAMSSGLIQVLDKHGVQFIDLNFDELIPVRTRDGWFPNNTHLWLPKHVCDADFILSMPKLKTHHWTGVTLSLKNLIGTIPGSRYGWSKNIVHMNGVNRTIIGIYQLLPPVISIVDGIIGMEGNGPLYGEPVKHGLIALGSDPLAVDTICTQLMGFSVNDILHLSAAAWAGIGQAKRIETRGVSPDQLQEHYKPPPKY